MKVMIHKTMHIQYIPVTSGIPIEMVGSNLLTGE